MLIINNQYFMFDVSRFQDSLKVAKCLVGSDAHEWINEIPTVPIYHSAKSQPRERAWQKQRGKKTLLSLTLARHCEVSYEV
uniref:Transposase n=1 Tax=Parastrongyloides trichosuri TaxID=131310 RepID=A0A0N4Z1C6_PARTI